MSSCVNVGVSGALALLCTVTVADTLTTNSPTPAATPSALSGVQFSCPPGQIAQLRRHMAIYLRKLGIDEHLVVRREPADGSLIYTLATPETDTDTQNLKRRKEYRIQDEVVRLPAKDGTSRRLRTVSKKEILLALLQHGRLTQYRGTACTLDALRDDVGLRQNMVAWTDRLSWRWPDGGPAHWNAKIWDHGTPLAGVSVDKALMDAFLNQRQYGIGCYAATKLSYAHAVLDYHVRIKKDPATAARVRERLMHDGEPLDGVEPAAMWSFEKDFNPAQRNVPGKLLHMRRGVAPGNFVPGDWIYLLNTDPASSKKTGYEGSNAVYLGRGKFDDYYNDHRHSYTYREKLAEVYQWRHGVFSRRRDAHKARPLKDEDFERLSRTPAEGGLLLDIRVEPYLFGHEDLPRLPMP